MLSNISSKWDILLLPLCGKWQRYVLRPNWKWQDHCSQALWGSERLHQGVSFNPCWMRNISLQSLLLKFIWFLYVLTFALVSSFNLGVSGPTWSAVKLLLHRSWNLEMMSTLFRSVKKKYQDLVSSVGALNGCFSHPTNIWQYKLGETLMAVSFLLLCCKMLMNFGLTVF